MKHTPLPWEVVETEHTLHVRSNGTLFVADCMSEKDRSDIDEDRANADLIVLAVNNHEKLVEALKTLLECSPCQNGCDPNDMTCATNAARSLLAQIEKG